ncbi:MAG: membrane associated rhomboid family serine protease [Bacteroidia bacterium]|jgi:membrane associated rhomboid family serine protease
MQHYSSTNPNALTPMVKNLIIINGLMYLATYVLSSRGVSLSSTLGLFHPSSDHFEAWQILTHFFMHGGFMHLAMNMFGLFMFGRMLEVRWGPKRFLKFYMMTAFFAALLHFLVNHLQVQSAVSSLSATQIQDVLANGFGYLQNYQNYTDPAMAAYNNLVNMPVVGASGALFGILGACYVLFPNTVLYLIFPPIPIKLKVAVTLYGVYELYRGISNSPMDNVAHFAHLGGLVAGIIIVKYWNKTKRDSFF